MSQYQSQVQNMFLSQMRKKHQKVEVILETGNTLRDRLKSYDQYSITLLFKDKEEVVYKSSIIYITPLPNLPERRDVRRPYSSRPNNDYRSNNDYRPRPTRAPNIFEDTD